MTRSPIITFPEMTVVPVWQLISELNILFLLFLSSSGINVREVFAAFVQQVSCKRISYCTNMLLHSFNFFSFERNARGSPLSTHLWKLFQLFGVFFPTFSLSMTRLWSGSQGRMDQPLPLPCTSLNKRSAWCDFKGTGRSASWQLESGFGQARAWENSTCLVRRPTDRPPIRPWFKAQG